MKEQVVPVWHANGTVMMGRSEDPKSCVDTNFRVYGTRSLRVADLSICPLTAKFVTFIQLKVFANSSLAIILRAWLI
jgi:choline dehydrogenase-like flavoprotein